MTRILGSINRENEELICLYVKRVFTTKTKTYLINANGLLQTIISELLEDAHEIFEFESGMQLELVEAGQQIAGVKSEDAPALEINSPQETFKQRFHNGFNNVALYIRKV